MDFTAVIKQDARLPGFGLRVPHRKSYIISRDDLLEIVDLDELDSARSESYRKP